MKIENKKSLFNLVLILHDIGKVKTRQVVGDKIMFIGHDEEGAKIIKERLKKLRFSNDEIKYAELLVKYHMKIHQMENLDVKYKMEQLAKIYQIFHEDFELMNDLIRLSEIDGDRDYKELKDIINLFQKQKQIIRGEDVDNYPKELRGKIIKRMRYLQLAKGYDRPTLLKYLKSEGNNILSQESNLQ